LFSSMVLRDYCGPEGSPDALLGRSCSATDVRFTQS
jgi:hypothetical protein